MTTGKKQNTKGLEPAEPLVAKPQEPTLNAKEAQNFFQSLLESSEKKEEEQKKEVKTAQEQQQVQAAHAKTLQETVSRNANWDEGVEGIIKRNLLLGNLDGAVDCALKCGRIVSSVKIQCMLRLRPFCLRTPGATSCLTGRRTTSSTRRRTGSLRTSCAASSTKSSRS